MTARPATAEPSPLEVAKKASRQLEKVAGALASGLGALDPEALAERPFAVLAAATESLEALRSAETLLTALASNALELEQLRVLARDASERHRARFAGELSEALDAAGLRLAGRLPVLECGPLTLELTGAARPEVKLYYGPRVELLDTIDVDAKLVAAAVTKALAALEPGPLDESAFLSELYAAYRVALVRRGLPQGDKPSILDVLAELAFGRQSAAFRQNPSGKGFQGYSRLQFSHDLSRLERRTTTRPGGAPVELALTVATRDQTRRPQDHLWVGGTHFALLSFREAT